jgi:endonuclease/exonuclease/phosphatase family metal-dependent hydrolase
MRMTTLFLAAMLLTTGAAAHDLKVATWNIEHLRDGIGEGPNPRDQADFDRLRAYADILDADVIAFQEVENQAAADRVFDPAVYQIFISNRSHTQRTGFAVRKSIAAVSRSNWPRWRCRGTCSGKS